MENQNQENKDSLQPISSEPAAEQEILLAPSPSLQDKKPSSLKTFALVVVASVVVAIGLVNIVNSVLNRKFDSNPSFDITVETSQTNEEGSNPEQGSDIPPDTDVVDCGPGGPFVRVLYPNGGETLVAGERVLVRWELCGVSSSLLERVMVEYFDQDTQQLLGGFNLSCLVTPEPDEISILWDVPAYIETEDNMECNITQDVDFLDTHLYKLRLYYANNSYQDTSDDFFAIDASQYVYDAPDFSSYVVASPDQFTRASGLAEDAPPFLLNQISASFFQTPPTFAGYYRTFNLTCGPNCYSDTFVIDLRDGRVFDAPQHESYVVDKESRLYALEYGEADAGPEDFQARDVYVVWYEFLEQTKEFVFIDDKLCNVVEGVLDDRYVDCVQP